SSAPAAPRILTAQFATSEQISERDEERTTLVSADCTYSISGPRQILRIDRGGANPRRKRGAERSPSTCVAMFQAFALMVLGAAPATTSASTSATVPRLSVSILRFATVGWPRPASPSLPAER